MKRLLLDVEDEFYNKVKKQVKARNITLKKWILRAILNQLRIEEQFE